MCTDITHKIKITKSNFKNLQIIERDNDNGKLLLTIKALRTIAVHQMSGFCDKNPGKWCNRRCCESSLASLIILMQVYYIQLINNYKKSIN